MFGRSKQPVVSEMPPDVSTHTLAGSAALGGSGVSGQVAPWNAIPTIALTSRRPGIVHQNAQSMPDLPADSLYTDRELRGGVQTLSAMGSMVDAPPFLGGFTLMANRPPLAVMEWHQMAPEQADGTEWREAPTVTNLCRTVPRVMGANGLTGKKVS